MSVMPHDLANMLSAFLVYIVGAASPGLGNMTIATTSVQQGRLPGFAVTAGVMTAGQTWALLAAIGLSSVLVAMPAAMMTIGIAGGVYLVWLAWRTNMRRPVAAGGDTGTAGTSLAGNFRRGFFIQILNPKAVVGWILIIATGVRQDSPWYVPLAIVLGCLVLGAVIFSSYVLLFSSRMLTRETVANSTGFKYALVTVYSLSGLWLIVDSLQR
ncbi:LysE family translocator [Stappia sp.]|jgi:threonine/homoserine/homoserine lactone efflux protein|uniref:LysE family translocator n=1 Tax=Stappia sp. TaxID=1870903 RepID=UPI003D129FD0